MSQFTLYLFYCFELQKCTSISSN